MEKLTVWYQVSDEVLKREVIESGVYTKPQRVAEFDLEGMEPATRKKLFDLGALSFTNWGTLQTMVDIRSWDRWNDELIKKEPCRLEGEPSIETVVDFLEKQKVFNDEIKRAKDERDRTEKELQDQVSAIFEREQIKLKDIIQARDLEKLNNYVLPEFPDTFPARKLIESLRTIRRIGLSELNNEMKQAERERWIRDHGSEHLKKALEEGFDCKHLYTQERVFFEAPGFIVDFHDHARWEDEYCPSLATLKALEEARELSLGDPKIILLTSYPDDTDGEDYPEDIEPMEAILIEKYLDEYDIIKPIREV